MKLEDAQHFSKLAEATHQIQGHKSVFRWKKGEEYPTLDRTYEYGFGILENGMLRKHESTVKDETLLKVLRESPGWEPVLSSIKGMHPLEVLAHCADDDEETRPE